MYADKLDVAVLAGLLVLVAATAFFLLQQPAPSSPCSGLDPLPGQLDCFAAVANTSGLAACADAPLPDACAGLWAFSDARIERCESWPDAEACRYFYYSARLSGNGSFPSAQTAVSDCRSLANASWRSLCFLRHAHVLKDSRFCHELDTDYYRDQCLDQVARTT